MVGVGVVGFGYWGPNLVRNFSELPGSDVVAVCDPDAAKLARISGNRRYHGVKPVSDLRDILSDSSIDAVVVATPTMTHYDVTRACLEAGKHVLVEKPLTFDPTHSLELTRLAEGQGRVLMVGHIFMYNVVVRRMKEEIAQGNIGDVLYMNAERTGLGPIRQDVNALWDLAPHDVSMFNYLLGSRPESVRADGRIYVQKDRGLEDVAFVTLDYPGNIMAGINVSWVAPVKTRKLTVVGKGRMMVFDDVALDDKLAIHDKGADYQPQSGEFGEFQLALRDGDKVFPRIRPNEPLRDECSHFLDCMTQNQTPLTDGKNGYEVVAALAAAQESLKSGGVPVQIEYKM